MKNYLDYKFEDTETFINTFDEAPLWSAAFGLMLLKHLEVKPNLTIVDIGCGAGFPLFELAGRFGPTCRLIGIDPWENACLRAVKKIDNYGYSNVEIVNASADKLLFVDSTIDLVVSNLGINNFENPDIVFKECQRVLKPGGKLALTTNIMGHWKEFYDVFYTTLEELLLEQFKPSLDYEVKHRSNQDGVSKLFTDNGFDVIRIERDKLEMKFTDGTAFLNHHFVKLGWISSWIGLFPKELNEQIFSTLENNLNEKASKESGLILTVPMLFMEGEKPE